MIAHDTFIPTDRYLSSFSRVSIEEADLLGAPLFPGPALDRAWSSRCAELTQAVTRLKLLGSQDALLLLRASFSAPKVMHLLRCSPSVSHPALLEFDGLLRTAIEQLTNSSLTDMQWLQASLPIRFGGLGVRRVSSLANPAFIASAASTLHLQDLILTDCELPDCRFLQDNTTLWSSSFGQLPSPLPSKQSFWDLPGIVSDRSVVEAGVVGSYQRACFLASSSRHSGDWLFAFPVSSCGLKLDDEAVRVGVGLRLGLDVCVPHSCRCDAQVDARGLHAFVCKRARGRTLRHHALNDVVARAFVSAGIPVIKEPTGLFRTDGKRPDGMTLIPWQAGKPVIWDATVTCTSADSYIDASAREAGAAAEIAAARKSAKYIDLSSQYEFHPIAVETQGPLNESACELLSDIGRRITQLSGDDRESFFLFQRISVVVQRFNSVLLHDSFCVVDQPE